MVCPSFLPPPGSYPPLLPYPYSGRRRRCPRSFFEALRLAGPATAVTVAVRCGAGCSGGQRNVWGGGGRGVCGSWMNKIPIVLECSYILKPLNNFCARMVWLSLNLFPHEG